MEYLALFGASFLAATLLPFPSELPLAMLVRARHELLLPTTVATAGNFLGACTTYVIARAAVARLRPAADGGNGRALVIWRRYGAPALLLSWLPVVGDALVAAAGAARLPFAPFAFWTLVGKAARYAVVAWAALS